MTGNQNVSSELGEAPVGKLLLKLAVPSVLAQLVSLLYNIVDRIYIGHMEGVGSVALTGVGLCFPMICIINAFTMLIAQGGAPLSSISMGKNEKERAEKILGNCTAMLVIVAAVLSVIFLFTGNKLLMIFGASEDTILYAWPYMRIYLLGSVFVMLSLGLNLFITAQGFSKVSMVNVITGAVLNIILDPIFIFALNLGVVGAALATVFSQMVVAVMAVYFLCGKKAVLRIRKIYFKPDRAIMGSVFALGVSPFIMQATEAALSLAFNFSLQKYGGDIAVGAMTIANTVMQMFWVPSNGIGQGAQPIISFNYGAGNVERVKKAVKLLFIVAETFMFVCWGIVELFPETFIRMFNNSSEELIATTVWALRVYIAAIGLFGIQMGVQQTFVSTGQAKASLFIACLRKIILLIPLIFILPCFMENKVLAVFLAEPVSDLLSVTIAAILFMALFPKMLGRLEEKEKS